MPHNTNTSETPIGRAEAVEASATATRSSPTIAPLGSSPLPPLGASLSQLNTLLSGTDLAAANNNNNATPTADASTPVGAPSRPRLAGSIPKEELDALREARRPPPLNLPPLPPIQSIVKPREGELSIIVSTNNNKHANNAHNNITHGGAPAAGGTRREASPPRRTNQLASGTVVDVLTSAQGATVMTAPIQGKGNHQKGSFFQHFIASMEMRLFASTLQMGADADTRMGRREIAAVNQVAERLAADASRHEDKDRMGESRPPLTIASVSDCFRLFFGSNVTIFPYYACRLGSVGLVAIASASCVINTNTMMCLHRARHNLVAIELHRRIDEKILDANGLTPRHGATLSSGHPTPRKGDDNDLNLFIQHAAARAKLEQEGDARGSVGSLPLSALNIGSSTTFLNMPNQGSAAGDNGAGASSPSASGSADDLSQELTIADFAAMQEQTSGGDIMPYFMSLNSMVKIGNALWPDHWLRHAIVICACVAQFFSSCNFCLLMAKNFAPIAGLGEMQAVALCATLMAILTMLNKPKTKTYLAYCSNLFIFGGGGLLLAASLGHEQTPEELAMPVQVLPKSVADFIMYSPSVLMFLAAPIVTVDVETIVAARIYPIIKSTFELHRSSITPPMTPMSSGSSRCESPSNAVPGGGGTSPRMSPTLSPTNSPAISPTSYHARRFNPSLVYVNIIQKYYGFAMRLGLLLCVIILLTIAELILWSFRDNTNSVIALSLPESTIRTAILISLSIGLYACGALNLGPICDLLDGFSKTISALSFAPIIKRAITRAALFSFVALFLYMVPFFDLVAALSSTIRGSTLVFFIPPTCELQSEILRAAAKSQNREYAAKANFLQRFMLGFTSMPLRSKLVFIMGMVLGCFVLFVSTYFIVMETIRRQSGGK